MFLPTGGLIRSNFDRKDDHESDSRRDSHNTAEKRRRDKINEKIEELSQLISNNPNKMNKAAVLGSTVEHINALESRYQVCYYIHLFGND